MAVKHTETNAMRLNPILKKYLNDLAETARRGDAREESFYPALSSLLDEVARAVAPRR